MTAFLRLLLGPEIFWLLLYLALQGLIVVTESPQKSMDRYWIRLATLVPFIIVPLSFTIYFLPGVVYSWMLLRMWLAGLVGAHYVLDRGMNAHTEQGPGVGTAYIMGMLFVICMLFICSLYILSRF